MSQASAFFKLPNLVCGRSEGPQSALVVEMCMAQHLSVWAQTNRWLRSTPKSTLQITTGKVNYVFLIIESVMAFPRVSANWSHLPNKVWTAFVRLGMLS
jgi:hypothetical protein